ncbi:DUF4296 domain-containing protein [Myroides sp. DW712]|uniref:DUF4296 domain-containing protein n=1 Tax=Myroides sp. DW712 TaxID=3389800 RepID=UPI00397C9084
MKHFIVFFCLALLLFSCQKEISKPNPFIEQSKMEDILYDMALLYGMQTINSFASDTVKAVQVKDIFEKYSIDSLTFTENNRYYVMLKKGVYFDMQNHVIERLKKEKERIDSLRPNELELTPVNAVIPDTISEKTPIKKESEMENQKTIGNKKEKTSLRSGEKKTLLKAIKLKHQEQTVVE